MTIQRGVLIQQFLLVVMPNIIDKTYLIVARLCLGEDYFDTWFNVSIFKNKWALPLQFKNS